ncbi:NOP14 [Symbiodinium necroappetens]|nr:NOP14 [Symbiodinium necroappetens]
MGGAGNPFAEALIQKWSRGLRLFEEHARRTAARGDQAVYHKFNCDLHVLVAKHTADADLHFAKVEGPQRDYWERRKSITGSAAESGCNWDRDGFKQWEGWTTEDFIYHEVETDHDTIKNSPLMRKIVFKELGGFCGMDF